MRLYLTHCSAEKRKEGDFPPDKLYKSDRIDGFVKRCQSNNLDWAILSAKHGLFFPEDRHSNYDTTFRSKNYECRVVKSGEVLGQKESRNHFQGLTREIKNDIVDKYSKITFYAQAPQRTKFYLILLHKDIDRCSEKHRTTDEIKSCIREHGNINIVRRLENID